MEPMNSRDVLPKCSRGGVGCVGRWGGWVGHAGVGWVM